MQLPEGVNLKMLDGKLSLVHERKRLKPLSIDFVDIWRNAKIGKKDELAKAVGISLDCRKVVDMTAGLGTDSIRLLKLGCQVTAFEQSPVLFALLEDALKRARESGFWKADTDSRFSLQHGDSSLALSKFKLSDAEVLFLDPMFPSEKKKGESSREMQYLQEVVPGNEESTEAIVGAALAFGARRTVLKRPQHSRPWSKPKADLIFAGRSVRYEVWLKP